MNPCFCYRGLVVDIIHRLWDDGLYVDNKWLKLVHQNWFSFWVDYKTCLTMQDVDQQIEEMFEESKITPPIYWEQEKGETPLGGLIGYTYEFADDGPGSSDTVQGPE